MFSYKCDCSYVDVVEGRCNCKDSKEYKIKKEIYKIFSSFKRLITFYVLFVVLINLILTLFIFLDSSGILLPMFKFIFVPGSLPKL